MEQFKREHHPNYLDGKADPESSARSLAALSGDLKRFSRQLDTDGLSEATSRNSRYGTFGDRCNICLGLIDSMTSGGRPNGNTDRSEKYAELSKPLRSLLKALNGRSAVYDGLISAAVSDFDRAMLACFDRSYVLLSRETED